MTSSDSAAGSLSSSVDSYSAPSDDSDDLVYSVSNPPSPDSIRKKQSDTESEVTASSDQDSSQVSSVVATNDKENKQESVSYMGKYSFQCRPNTQIVFLTSL